MSVETCIVCGEVIPEGRQVCPVCEKKFSTPIFTRDDTINAFMEGMKKGKIEALEEAARKFEEYGSVWIQYEIGKRQTREEFAQMIVNLAKKSIIETLEGMRNDLQTSDT